MKKLFSIGLILALLMALVGGCAFTHTQSFKDPLCAGTTYQKIVVVSTYDDLRNKSLCEKNFVKKFDSFGVSATAATVLMPPTEAFSMERLTELARNSGYDAILVADMTKAWNTARQKSGYARSYYSRKSGRAYSYYSPSRTITEPNYKFSITLVDLKTGKNAWVSSSLTSGTSMAGVQTMFRSVANKTVNTLEKDGLICKQRKKGH